jgi:hypothetical protein
MCRGSAVVRIDRSVTSRRSRRLRGMGVELRQVYEGWKAHYRNQSLRRVPEALGEALKTLGKGFAECDTRQRRLGKQCIGKDFFAEYFLSGTRQRCLPSAREHSAKKSGRYGAG